MVIMLIVVCVGAALSTAIKPGRAPISLLVVVAYEEIIQEKLSCLAA
jgi:uncharacterized membrane protein